MNITDAAHKTVKEYPGGSEALGPRIEMSAAVLRNKVNPNNNINHLTLVEASEIMGVTGDHRILRALAAEHGYGLTALNAESVERDVLSLVLEHHAADGAFAQVVAEALRDGRITPNEMDEILKASNAHQSLIFMLLRKLNAMSGQGMPA